MHELILLLLLLSIPSELQRLGDYVLQWNAGFIKTTLMRVHLSFKTTLETKKIPLLFPCGRAGFESQDKHD